MGYQGIKGKVEGRLHAEGAGDVKQAATVFEPSESPIKLRDDAEEA